MIYILGSGPSLDDFDYTALQNKTVLAINDAGIMQFPDATMLISTDQRWWSRAPGQIKKFKGDVIIGTEKAEMDKIHDPRLVYFIRKREFGLSAKQGVLHGIYTGVHAALNFCALQGWKEIVLLGVDLKPAGDRKYTYGGKTTVRTERQFKNMKAAITSCAGPLKNLGIKVINASPDSAITCFERCRPSDVV